MADHVVPHAEIIARTDKLQKILLAGRYDGALIAQKTDLFYFGGTAQQGWLYVPAQGRPVLM
ncbi:MAG: aminopeptidase P family N-terminal domain-containing protein, partial [Desulforhopalus sp.]|nr:aminopeptidase P family N-terminal domain-containing protein [Desulforhopalus sp.]